MAGAFDRFQRPDDPQTAGSAFEPVTWQQQLQNYRQLEGQDAAWRSADGSPWKPKEPGAFAKAVTSALESEPGQRAMTLANFLGPGAKGIRAYHGSPHKFDKFEWSPRTRGTGEGAGIYGDGLYFAENEAVARGYRDALSPGWNLKDGRRNLKPQTMEEQFAANFLKNAMREDQRNPYITATNTLRQSMTSEVVNKRSDIEAILREWQKRGVSGKPSGHMYEVNLKANPGDFLDWDMPLIQQGEKAKALLDHPAVKPFTEDGWMDRVRGSQAYRSIAGGEPVAGIYKNPEAASGYLRDLGIPGIRYKDAGSRGAEGGTNNFVVFDDSLIEIIRKYGLAGLLAGGGALGTQGGGNGGDL